MDALDIVDHLLIVVPPLDVYHHEGVGRDFWINVVLTLIGYLPGLLHAVWVIYLRDDADPDEGYR